LPAGNEAARDKNFPGTNPGFAPLKSDIMLKRSGTSQIQLDFGGQCIAHPTIVAAVPRVISYRAATTHFPPHHPQSLAGCAGSHVHRPARQIRITIWHAAAWGKELEKY